MPEQMLAIVGRGVEIVIWRDQRDHDFREPVWCRLVELHRNEFLFRFFQTPRRISYAHHGDARRLQSGWPSANRDGDTCERKVSETTCNLLESPSVLRENRKFDLHDDLIGLKTVGQGVDEELPGRDRPTT